MTKTLKRPRDLNQWAAQMVAIATGNASERTTKQERQKNAAAVELGRLGGLKGGKARASKLTSAERSASARKAVKARWKNKTKKTTT